MKLHIYYQVVLLNSLKTALTLIIMGFIIEIVLLTLQEEGIIPSNMGFTTD